jgi:hypothetical protein
VPRNNGSPRILQIATLASMVLTVARVTSADCTAILRSPNAAEKKIYADAFALFQRVAPAPPSGWEARDSPDSDLLKEVCANRGEQIVRWTFSRSFVRTDNERQRATAQRQVEGVVQDAEAARKANQAKLADVDRQIDAVTKRMQTLASAQKFAEMEAAGAELERLMDEKQQLMGLAGQEKAMSAIDAQASKDTRATFSLTVNETSVDTARMKPLATPAGKGFRRDYQSGGNPQSELLVIVPPSAVRGSGQLVLRSQGDPSRAEALLAAALKAASF